MKRSCLLLAIFFAACGEDGTGPDVPGVGSSQPAPNADDVSVATDVRITFARVVDLPGDTANALWLEQDGERVPVRVTRPEPRVVVLTPADVLDPAASYTVHIGVGITSGGDVVPAADWQFTTAGRPAPAVDGNRLLSHVRALADDSLRGRGSVTPDELKAAGYIRTVFGNYGLSAFSGSQWYQGFTISNVGNSQNVIGVLRGEGALRDEWIVIGAHYDHIGIRNGFIHNGADDNASGTAGVLELARLLVQHASADGFGSNSRRSLMFITFGAEELGLIGSNLYCREPLVPLNRVAAMINLDMIGRISNNLLYVIGENTGQEWAAMLRRYNNTFDYTAMSDAGTDYRCFKLAGRPVMSLFTGLHADYHKPSDDTELIDVPGITAVTTLALNLAVNTAVRPRPFTR